MQAAAAAALAREQRILAHRSEIDALNAPPFEAMRHPRIEPIGAGSPDIA